MINVSIGNVPCFSPVIALQMLRDNGRPIPEEMSRVNTFMNPQGRESARCWVLMLLNDLNSLNINSLQNLTIDTVDQENLNAPDAGSLIIDNLVITKEPKNLFSGYIPSDVNSVYLVELADSRFRVHNDDYHVSINASYNVRAGAYLGGTGTNAYLPGSLNGGTSLWTWQTMISDIWNNFSSQLGSAPTLPSTPDGNPEGFVFKAMSAWDALFTVLDKLGFSVNYAPTSGIYTIVQIGNDDTALDQTIAGATKLLDREYLSYSRRLPAGCRVFFHRQEKYPGQEQTTPRTTSNWLPNSMYSVDVAGPDSNSEPGVYHPIVDDLPAIFDGGALTNGSALTTRATNITANFFSNLRTLGGGRLWTRYFGLLDISPSSIFRGVAWYFGANGTLTEVVRHPALTFKVSGGYWEENKGSSRLSPVDLRPTFPVYPFLGQVVNVTNMSNVGQDPGGLYYYTAVMDKYDHTHGFIGEESVYALEITGQSTVTPGNYLARLVDYLPGTDTPVYAISFTPGGGAPLTFSVGDGTTTYTGITKINVSPTHGLNLSVAGSIATFFLEGINTSTSGSLTTYTFIANDPTQTIVIQAGTTTPTNATVVITGGSGGGTLTATGGNSSSIASPIGSTPISWLFPIGGGQNNTVSVGGGTNIFGLGVSGGAVTFSDNSGAVISAVGLTSSGLSLDIGGTVSTGQTYNNTTGGGFVQNNADTAKYVGGLRVSGGWKPPTTISSGELNLIGCPANSSGPIDYVLVDAYKIPYGGGTWPSGAPNDAGTAILKLCAAIGTMSGGTQP